MWRARRLDAGVLLLLLVATVFFCWPLITPDLTHRQSFMSGDFYDQFHAFAVYKHDRLWARQLPGGIPLWNPYTFGGHPFLADVQAAVFYPLGLLVMLLNGPGPFSPFWLELEAVGHFYLAAVFTYLFVKRLVALRSAALISALAFAFGGYLTSYPPLQLAILETQIWLPLVLLLLDIGLAERRYRFIVGAGLAWGMALLAGHPQSAMYVFYAALGYAITVSFCMIRRSGGRAAGAPESRKVGKSAWLFFALAQLMWIGIGFGLAAGHLLPAWEYMRLSVRASATYQELAGGFGWRDLAQYVLPGRFTQWSPVYVGIVPLLLALVGIGGVRDKKVRSKGGVPDSLFLTLNFFFIALALLCLVLSLGGHTPLYRLFYWIAPGFNLFRSQERAIYLTSFALAVLAGYGWKRVVEGGWPARWRAWAAAAVLSLIVVDLWLVNGQVNLAPGQAEERVYDGAWLLALRQEDSLFRIANEWGLPGNGGCWLRLQDLYGASPLRLQMHKVMADALPHWRLWQLFGVRYVAGWEHDLSGPFKAVRVAMQGEEWQKNTVYVHRLETDFPRAWVAYQARQVSDLEALALLADPSFDLYQQVLLNEPAPAEFASSSATVPAMVDVLYKPEEIIVQVELFASGWLVLGEWDYPGWQVWVDGARQQIYRADYGLRAVPLTAGQRRVEFRYRPTSFYAGAALSVLTALICLVGVLCKL